MGGWWCIEDPCMYAKLQHFILHYTIYIIMHACSYTEQSIKILSYRKVKTFGNIRTL